MKLSPANLSLICHALGKEAEHYRRLAKLPDSDPAAVMACERMALEAEILMSVMGTAVSVSVAVPKPVKGEGSPC